MNILLLTSCNRIKQVLLSLSLNAQIIKKPFSVVIIDCSTPQIDAETMCKLHDLNDPYNLVKPYNYCSDVNLLYEGHKYFPNIEEYKVIHYSPRLEKQRGEATSIALGLMQASLIGNRTYKTEKNFCLKLTGTSILCQDELSKLPQYLEDSDVVTWHRTNIGGEQRSTRIFGCRPEILSSLITNEGWYNWCDDNSAVLETRFADIINKKIPTRINYVRKDETGVLLEGGMGMQQNYGRQKIEDFIKLHNIDTSNPYLEDFKNGNIW
jgi:hypothetical protein